MSKNLFIVGRFLSFGVVAAITLFIAFVAIPLNTYDLKNPPPQAIKEYAQAIAEIERIKDQDTAEINEVCRTRFFTHGQKTARSITIIHGLSNCPQQFEMLGQELFEQGYNVFIPRMPHHGYAERLTTQLAEVNAQEMIDFTSHMVDISAGLAEHQTLLGLSVGGIMTAWAGQSRADLEHAIVIAPNLGYLMYTPWNNAISRISLWYPNQFWWWDDQLQLNIPGPQYAYPRYATHAVGESFKLGRYVQRVANTSVPQSNHLTMVTNAHDEAVNPEHIAQLVRAWQFRSSQKVSTYEFPKSYGVGHDIIDPLQPYADPELIYPKLSEIIASR